MIKTVFQMTDELQEKTALSAKLNYMMEEVGELATEISIIEGNSTKGPGPDGVVGEAIDVIACCLDIIRKAAPDVSESTLESIMECKCQTWIANVNYKRAKNDAKN